MELVSDAGAELGYYTDAHASLSTAFGWSAAPLWTFDVHMAHPGLVEGVATASSGHEAFVYASLEGFAYAYNALTDRIVEPAVRARVRPVPVPARGDVLYDVSKILLNL